MSDAASVFGSVSDRPFVDVMPEEPSVDREKIEAAERLLDATCARYLVTPIELRRPGRSTKPIAAARRALSGALRDLGWNYVEIGRFVGRDRTTVMAALGAAHKERRRANG